MVAGTTSGTCCAGEGRAFRVPARVDAWILAFLFALPGPGGAVSAADAASLAERCAECHGKNGAATEPDMPIIGGYSVEFLVNNMKAYQKKDRQCPETKVRSGPHKGEKSDMCRVLKDLGPADLEALARHFAAQKFVRARQPFDAALARKGRQLHLDYCEKCHSEGGTVADDEAGLPAGQWVAYLRQAMDEFRTGRRPIAKKMKAKLDQVDDAGVEALVQYYASLQ
jgi:sulfide dehydrogenase cytochrome subunit